MQENTVYSYNTWRFSLHKIWFWNVILLYTETFIHVQVLTKNDSNKKAAIIVLLQEGLGLYN